MKTISDKQAQAIIAFMDGFDLYITGAWPQIEAHMEEAGIENPEDDLEDAMQALRK